MPESVSSVASSEEDVSSEDSVSSEDGVSSVDAGVSAVVSVALDSALGGTTTLAVGGTGTGVSNPSAFLVLTRSPSA